MTTPDRADALPEVILRAPIDTDAAFLAFLAAPEVTGEWDSFDEAPDQLLRGADFGGGLLLVELEDATRVGSVSWIQIPYGPNVKSLAWSIGVTIHPDHRRRHFAAAAQRRLAQRLLATSAANRVQADTDPLNVAEQRALLRAGFTREATARGAQWRGGTWHDRVVYSVLRSELAE